MTLVDVVPLAMLGGLLGLDVVTFPQAMVSRPLVAATITGALVGHATSGLLVGAILELIALETLPFGASRYPEWGSAAVVGGALFSTHPSHPPGAAGLAIFGALATAWIGGWTMVKLREQNARWARSRREAIAAGSRDAVIGLQVLGLGADVARGALLTAIALVVFSPIGEAAVGLWTVDARLTRAVVAGVAASVTGAAAWKLFHRTPGALWLLAAGLVGGLTVLAVQWA